MGCKSCNKKANYFMPCKVCELLDENNNPQMTYYCNACKAYICFNCSSQWDRRVKAALKNILL